MTLRTMKERSAGDSFCTFKVCVERILDSRKVKIYQISLMFLMILTLVLPILHLHQSGPKGKKPKKIVIFEVSSNSDVCPSRLVFDVPVSVP